MHDGHIVGDGKTKTKTWLLLPYFCYCAIFVCFSSLLFYVSLHVSLHVSLSICIVKFVIALLLYLRVSDCCLTPSGIFFLTISWQE
jgi:hypothetical protein